MYLKTESTYLELALVYFQLFKIMKKEKTTFKRNLSVMHKTSEKVTATVSSDEGQKARTDPYH